MIDYELTLKIPPYSLQKEEKDILLVDALRELTSHHLNGCLEYSNFLRANGVNPQEILRVEDVPFLPVRLFKDFDLKSVPNQEIVKTMTSSGTSGQKVSRIYLDKATAAIQTKVLASLISDQIGNFRLPMLIIDSPSVLKNRNLFSARGAGILGFSTFGKDRTFALDDSMRLDIELINKFLEAHKGEKVFIFGFTFMIWEYFYKPLSKSKIYLPLDHGILIHGGGWKKLLDQSVSNDAFRAAIRDVSGIERIHDYYGMVEQTGSINFECERGYLHTSIFGDVIVRDYKNFLPSPDGERGVLQVLSILPQSYPGHSLLTEDEGVILGIDDCPCGRKGKYFKVLGRIQNAEIRGCSDTYTTNP